MNGRYNTRYKLSLAINKFNYFNYLTIFYQLHETQNDPQVLN